MRLSQRYANPAPRRRAEKERAPLIVTIGLLQICHFFPPREESLLIFKIRTNGDEPRLLPNKPGDENGLRIFPVSLVVEVSGCEEDLKYFVLHFHKVTGELSELSVNYFKH